MLHQASVIALVLAAGEPVPDPIKKTIDKPGATQLTELKVKLGGGAIKGGDKTIVSVAINDKTYTSAVVQPEKKRVVFVDFWASYCVPCLDELPHLEAMKTRLGKDADVAFVNVDPPTTNLGTVLSKRNVRIAQTFRIENEDPEPFINAVDPKWMGEVPFGAIYDRSGKLVKTFSGEQKIEDIEKAIREVVAKK